MIGDWQELSALYERADELEEPALEAWLTRLETEGHRLLPQLRRMLAARGRVASSNFLDRLPPMAPRSDRDHPWRREEGHRFGPYRLLRHLGSGGSAEVWLAERADSTFERQVAIKLLHSHPTGSQRESFAERFRRERDFLAALDHPHIAGLHDAGVTPEGQPWLAVEYVEGEPITEWCDRNRLPMAARVEVFLQVLRAVEHAHANLVLHRDLKPGNIFVTRDGRARLLDFGIAKLISADGSASNTELTNEAGRPLTLQYASPEQLLGAPLSTRTDVYTLGVVLYELLTGVRPYELKFISPAQVEQAILESEPRPPSRREISTGIAERRSATVASVRRVLARDLDAIVLHCLCKEPEKRYSSVEALRKDIERWQRNEPIEARRPTAWYRIGRFVSRHTLPVSLAGAAIAGVLAAASIALWMSIDARREATRAVAARDFLLDVYRLTDPDSTPNGSVDKRTMLQAGAQKALAELEGQPMLQAQVLTSIGQMQTNISDYRAAERNLSLAEQRFREVGARRATIEVHAGLARNAFYMGSIGRAQELADAAAISAAAAFPQDDELQFRVLAVRGRVRAQATDRQVAREDLTRAIALGHRLYPAADSRTLEVMRDLAILEGNAQNFDTARALLTSASNSAATVTGVGARMRIGLVVDRGQLEIAAGRYAAAAALLRELAPRCEDTLGRDTEDCVVIRITRAIVALRMGDRSDAAAMLDPLLREAGNDNSPRRQAESLVQAGRILALDGPAETRQAIGVRLSLLATTPGQSLVHRCSALLALAEDSLQRGNPELAEKWARQAMELQRGSAEPSRLWLGRAEVVLAVALHTQRKTESALNLFEEADRTLVEALGPQHPLIHLLRMNAVTLWRETGQKARAAAACDAAAGPLREAMGPSAPVMLRVAALCATPGAEASAPPERRAVPDFFT